MARIIGIDVPNNKRLEISLTYIPGVGKYIAKEIITKLKLDPNMKVKDLKNEDIARINDLLQKEYLVAGDLKREVNNNISRLKTIKSYRGLRHQKGLPVRGQRTCSNARTKKGRRKSAIVRKKK